MTVRHPSTCSGSGSTELVAGRAQSRDEIAQSPSKTVRQAHRPERSRRTGTRSLGTDTLLRVFAWCLSPSEPGLAPSGTTEPVPAQYVEAMRGEPARQPALRATPHLQCVRGCAFRLRLRMTAWTHCNPGAMGAQRRIRDGSRSVHESCAFSEQEHDHRGGE
jgi:hypothetical protein